MVFFWKFRKKKTRLVLLFSSRENNSDNHMAKAKHVSFWHSCKNNTRNFLTSSLTPSLIERSLLRGRHYYCYLQNDMCRLWGWYACSSANSSANSSTNKGRRIKFKSGSLAKRGRSLYSWRDIYLLLILKKIWSWKKTIHPYDMIKWLNLRCAV